MSVNRQVTVPSGPGGGTSVTVTVTSRAALSGGAPRSARAAAPPGRAGSPGPRSAGRGRPPRSPRSRGPGRSSARRRRPGRCGACRRGPTARRRTRPGPSVAIVSPSRTTPDAARRDDEEAGPDVALAGDDLAGFERRPRPTGRRCRRARRRRRRRTAARPPAARSLRSRVSVIRRPPDGLPADLMAQRPRCCAARRSEPSRSPARTNGCTGRRTWHDADVDDRDQELVDAHRRLRACSPTSPRRSSRAIVHTFEERDLRRSGSASFARA